MFQKDESDQDDVVEFKLNGEPTKRIPASNINVGGGAIGVLKQPKNGGYQ